MAVDHKLSPGNVARAVYEPTNDTIRVSLIGSSTPTLPSVVQLSDGIGYISSTVVGSDRALDVNIVNGIELTVSHLDDSIRLGNGVDYLTSSTSGSKIGLDVALINDGIANTPTVANVSMPTALTEYSYSIPINTKKLTFKTRNSSKLQFTFTSGQSGTTFITVSAGSSYTLENLNTTSSLTLYFQSNKASETLEILKWS